MSLYAFQVLNGLGLGMIYFLVAVGLTIIFGLLHFVNFAHGAFYLLGAYFSYQVVASTGSFWWSLLVAPILVGILAFLAERLLIHRVYRLPHMFHILITLGMGLVIQEATIQQWGPVGVNVPVPDGLTSVVHFGQFAYPTFRLFVIAVAAAVGIVLWILLERTRLGALIRAGSENTQMVALLGVDIHRLFSLTFALGAALAALAGVLAAPVRGAEPFMGADALGIAFVVVVIGGMGSFSGALVGGLLVGLVQAVSSSIWPQGARIMIYGAMAVVIFLRPRGLFGRA
jgi:branched-chain amino acid transport system permease protein